MMTLGECMQSTAASTILALAIATAALAGSQEEQRRLTPSDIAAMATKCDCADVTFFARERIMAALARMFQVVARDALIDIAELPK